MYNKIILIGNLTKDPELRYTPQGTPVASFRLAVNYRYKQSAGGGDEIKQEAMFIDNVVFGKQAESCSKYLNKGSSVLVEGRLHERRWESNGQHRSKFEVIAQSVRFLSKKVGIQEQAAEGDIVPPEEITDLEPF
ncbi:MAG: single-stranded DNA-binding protein [Nitrospirota bacterium]